MSKTLVAMAVAILALSSPVQASADNLSVNVHPDVAYALSVEPGGFATGYATAEWPELGMGLTVMSEVSGRAVGSCPTGNMCAFSDVNQGGLRLNWNTCGSKSVATLGRVAQITNARSSGTVKAMQGSTSRASATAGNSATVATSYRSSISAVSC